MNEQLPTPEGPSAGSRILFWVALFTPAAIALATMAAGKSSKELRDSGAVVSVLMMNFLLGAAAAIYCGCWLARRFCQPGGKRVLAALGLIFVIGLLNVIVTFAGCVTVVPIG